MHELGFPIWCLKYITGEQILQTSKTVVDKLIDLYVGLANNRNLGTDQDDSQIAVAIGKLCIETPNVVDDLGHILTREGCQAGMEAFLTVYDDGELPKLSSQVNDGGQYINVMKKKFNADAANWVWRQETAEQCIDDVILEYKIIIASGRAGVKGTSYDEVMMGWIDKCDNIRLSYPAAKSELTKVTGLLAMLYDLKRQGTLSDMRKQEFYNLLNNGADDFVDFYTHQEDIFKKVCEYTLSRYDLSTEDIIEIYKMIPVGSFTMSTSDYAKKVDDIIAQYNTNRASAKLRKLWSDRTGTRSPRAWSEQYRMPILCMVDGSIRQECRSAFATLNASKPNASDVDKAMTFLESATFYDALADASKRDDAFRSFIIKDCDTMLTDIDAVKSDLYDNISVSPYDWLGSPEVDKRIKQMADHKYQTEGCSRAMKLIDSMGDAEAKAYLKDLIKDNMTVGMVIIKEGQSHEH